MAFGGCRVVKRSHVVWVERSDTYKAMVQNAFLRVFIDDGYRTAQSILGLLKVTIYLDFRKLNIW